MNDEELIAFLDRIIKCKNMAKIELALEELREIIAANHTDERHIDLINEMLKNLPEIRSLGNKSTKIDFSDIELAIKGGR